LALFWTLTHFLFFIKFLAHVLKDMEIESHFLSNDKTRPQLQNHLERMLISLNTSPAAGAAAAAAPGSRQRQQHQQHGGGGGNIRTTSASGGGGGSGSAGGVECNLILSQAHVLNLKLFHPPKVPACPVPDRAVPVLLKRDWQVQTVRSLIFVSSFSPKDPRYERNVRLLSSICVVVVFLLLLLFACIGNDKTNK
jgi:hypothetical protein